MRDRRKTGNKHAPSNPDTTTILCIFEDADVKVHPHREDIILDQNFERQAMLVIGFLCRSVPDHVVTEFCRLTGADYEKIMELGFMSNADQPRGGWKRGKLTADQVRSIRSRHESGECTQAELAREFEISSAAISQIVRRKQYKWVED